MSETSLTTPVSTFGAHHYNVTTGELYWCDDLRRLLGIQSTVVPTFALSQDLLHEDDRARVSRAMVAALDPKGSGRFDEEFRIRRADSGDVRWFRNRSHTVFEGTGEARRAVRHFGTMEDITEAKRANDALRQSEQNYRVVFGLRGVGVSQVDHRSRRFLDVNPAFCELTGFSEAELLEMTDDGLTHPDDRASSRERGAAVAGRDTYQAEKRYVRKDGRAIDVLITGDVVRDLHGHPIRRVNIVQDITTRKHAEAAIRASEAQHAFLNALNEALRAQSDPAAVQATAMRMLGEHLKASRAGYAIEAGDGATVLVGPHYCDGVDEIGGRYFLPDFGPDLLRTMKEGRHLAYSDIPHEPTLTAQEKAARERLHVRALLDVPLIRDHALRAILFVQCREPRTWTQEEIDLVSTVASRTWDALERARAEVALRESEERFRLMADATPVILWVHDTTGGIEFVNRCYCEYFGTTVSEVLGPQWNVLVHPDDGSYGDAFMQALRTRTPFRGEARARRADGEWRWISSYGIPRYDDQGRFLGMIGTTQDITDQRRSLEAEREATRQKDQFIAVLAHELRNPLAPIRTATSLLRLRGVEAAVADRCAAVVERQVAHMARLLDDLLDVSRLSRGKLTLQRVPTDARALIDDAIEAARPLLEQQHHALDYTPAPRPIRLDADPARIVQVLTNLLNNAAKFTPPGGRIVVETALSAGHVAIHVRDNGVGIRPDMLGKVFHLFTQAGLGGDGLGIGLALAKNLVEMHGGTITVASRGPGTGTEFTVHLPRLADVETAAERRRPGPEGFRVQVAHKVLIVDDNQDAADLLELFLTEVGCEVRVAYDGETGLRILDEFPASLILLDLGLPQMSGYDVCRHIRVQPRGRRPTIAALTGWGDAADRERSQAAGFDVHLVKPVDDGTLLKLLRDLDDARPDSGPFPTPE